MSTSLAIWQEMLTLWDERITKAERTPGSPLPMRFPRSEASRMHVVWQTQWSYTPVINKINSRYNDLLDRWRALRDARECTSVPPSATADKAKAQECAPIPPASTVHTGRKQTPAPVPVNTAPKRAVEARGVPTPNEPSPVSMTAVPTRVVNRAQTPQTVQVTAEEKSSQYVCTTADEAFSSSHNVDNTTEHLPLETASSMAKKAFETKPEAADSDDSDVSYAPVGRKARMANMRSMVSMATRLETKAKRMAGMLKDVTPLYSSTAVSGLPQRQWDTPNALTSEKPTEASPHTEVLASNAAPAPLCNHTLDYSCECESMWSRWALGYETSMLGVTRDLTIFRHHYTTDENRKLWLCYSVTLDGGCQDPTCVLRHWAPEPNERLWMNKAFLELLDFFIWKPAPDQPGYKGSPRCMRDGRWCYGPGDLRRAAPEGANVIKKARPLKALYTGAKSKKKHQHHV